MSFTDLNTLAEKEMVPGFWGRFVHSPNMTMAYWNIVAGSPLPEHSHPHEQITTLLEGEFQLTVDGQVYHMHPGSVVVIPGGVRHSGLALKDCRIVDAFHPAREEYR
jgi:quercetin dioxygenase-like cupin family protein